MATWKEYLKSNKANLDLNKIKWLSKQEQTNAYNEWKTEGSLPKSYFKSEWKTITPSNKPITPEKKNTMNLWDVSKWNVMADKLQSTLSWMKEENQKLSSEQWDKYKAWAKEESELIRQKNLEAEQRANANQTTLDTNKQRDYASNEARRKEADDLLRRQEWIAARQANIAAAKAWSSWLQLSDATMEDIKADTIAKYWTNLANAEQFRNQTNITLDTALQNIDANYFKDKTQIDTLLKWLSDEEAAPLIWAVQKATEWDVQAIEDVKTYYNTLVQKKAEWEFGWLQAEEYIADKERVWDKADNAKKLWILQNEFKWTPILDVFVWNPSKFAGKTYAEVINTITKDSQLKELAETAIITAAWNWVYDKLPQSMKNVASQMWLDYTEAKKRFDRTAESKKDKIKTSDSLTWIKSTWTTIKPLPTKAQTKLDSVMSKIGKQKTIEKLKTWLANKSIDKNTYDRLVEYINNK